MCFTFQLLLEKAFKKQNIKIEKRIITVECWYQLPALRHGMVRGGNTHRAATQNAAPRACPA